jgi:hypothetical protein
MSHPRLIPVTLVVSLVFGCKLTERGVQEPPSETVYLLTGPAEDTNAILIQDRHAGAVDRMSVYHDDEATYIESTDLSDVRVFRRRHGEEEWQLYRQFNALLDRSSLWNEYQTEYTTVELPGEVQLYQDQTLVARLPSTPREGERPTLLKPPAGVDSAMRVLAIPVDRDGAPGYDFHGTLDGRAFGPMRFEGGEEVIGLYPLSQWTFATNDSEQRYTVRQVTSDGRIVPTELPGAPAELSGVWFLGGDAFAVRGLDPTLTVAATPFRSEKPGYTWHVYRWDPDQAAWVGAHDALGVSPAEIQRIYLHDHGAFSLQLRGETDDPDLLRRRYLAAAGRIQPLRSLDPAFDVDTHEVWAAGAGEIVGVQEIGDADLDGSWGSHHFRARVGDRWVPLAQRLPNLPGGEVLDIVDFGFGQGVGVKVQTQTQSPTWSWYLRDADAWVAARERLPNLAATTHQIEDLRDGLIRTTSFAATGAVEQWFVLDHQTKVWTDVLAVLASFDEVDGATLVDVDARTNALKLYLRDPSGRVRHRIALRDHQGRWQPAPELGRADRRTQTETLVRAAKVERSRDGATALVRATSPLRHEDLHLLQRDGDRWTRIRTASDEQQLSWAWRNGLLEQLDEQTTERVFYLHHRDSWSDVRKLVPNPPAEAMAAFAFADGHGVAIQDLRDAAWRYYLDDGSGRFETLERRLPGAYPAIATVFGFANGLGVATQEDGDADQDQVAGSWRYYVRKGQGWASLSTMLPKLPAQVETIRGSADGRLLLVQEQWDADGDGAQFEWTVALRDSTAANFEPLPSVPLDQICDGRTLANGRGVALRGCDADSRWQVFARSKARLEPISAITGEFGEALVSDERADAFAVKRRGADQWQVFVFDERGARRVLADVDPTAVELARGSVALRTSRGGADATTWTWYSLTGEQPERLGASGARPWFGLDHEDRGSLIVFAGANHFVDGQPRAGVPRSNLWLSADPRSIDGGDVFLAPELVAELVPGQTADHRLLAVSGGESARVVVYRSGADLFAVAVTDGALRIEQRPRLDGGQAQVFLVSAFPDGSERWYRWDAPNKMISAYVRDGDRVFFNNDGYYYSDTEDISDSMTFRIAGELYTFRQLGAHLFRPDLLERQLGLPSGALFELTPADRERISRAKQLSPDGVDLAALTPPRLRVVSKVADKTTAGQIEIELAAEGAGVTPAAVTARVLGAGQARALAYDPGTAKPEHQQISIRKQIDLLPGVNEIEVTVVDADGLSDSRRLTVEYTPTAPRKPTLWVLIAATERYEQGQFQSLPLTQADAKTIRRAFEGQTDLFARVEVRALCQRDGCDGAPNRAQILDELRRLGEQAAPGDAFAFYVSGHGTKVDDGYYLVPADGRSGAIGSLIAWSEVFDTLRGFPIGKKLVILDTCHAGAALDGQRDKRRLVQQTAERDGVYVLAATTADAKAYELRELGNGLFTHVLDEGLAGDADTGGDGLVSFEELAFHLGRRVRELSKAKGVRMEPYVPLIGARLDFDLAAVQRRARVRLRVIETTDFALAAKPERTKHWQRTIAEAIDVTWVDGTDGSRVLTIVETQGVPERAQLEIPGQEPLQWSLVSTPQRVVAEIAQTLAK